MRVAIIDADLLGRNKHRFPNLVCEKISAYHKENNDEVVLKLDYDNLDEFDEVYISKVFTDTPVPRRIADNVDMINVRTNLPDNIHVGGTGFFFDKAPELPYVIEHHMPDYHLYDEWIENEVERARQIFESEVEKARQILESEEEDEEFDEKKFRKQFKEYTDYSIGFTTRGCFRKCAFCVNQKYDHVFLHSPLAEFYDPNRKKICLLDDNILGCPRWREILNALIETGRPFKFKQGMDERLLTEEKCEMLFNANYDGDFTFAFDKIQDYDTIHRKLKMIRRHTKVRNIKFYVLVGFESTDAKDIKNMWKRVALLMKYQCIPYIMRYQNKNDTPWRRSEYAGMYITMARWCNQPSFYKKMSFRQFCEANQARVTTKGKICSSMKALMDFEEKYPKVAAKYFNLRYEDFGGILE